MQIVKIGAKHFIEEGYTKATMKRISRELDLSPGNITFYFPTKDHLLGVLISELFGFQRLIAEKSVEDKKNPILVYCLELAAIIAICAENEVAKDLYTSAYISPYTLDLIKKIGAKRAKSVFGDFCEDFSEGDFEAAEALVSGIEYGALTAGNETVSLHLVIEKALNAIMTLVRVPELLRMQNTDLVLSLDYKAVGKRILHEFREYIDNATELKEI